MNTDDIARATQALQQLAQIAAALNVLAGSNPSVIVEVVSDGSAAVRAPLNVPIANLVTLLTARQCAIQAQLTALGVTP